MNQNILSEFWDWMRVPRYSSRFTANPGFARRLPAWPGLLALCPLLLWLAGSNGRAADGEFFAYYTHLRSDEPFERYSRTGAAADIVVNVGARNGQLIFWRGASYLPYWKTTQGQWPVPEIIPRRGDGTTTQPDRVNAFSRVALIAQSPQQALICWRYLPQFTGGNPYGDVAATNFVEEYFVIRADGQVTRTVKQGTPKIDDWNDPLNQMTQVLQLEARGLREVSRKAAAHSPAPLPIAGNPVKGAAVVAPAREWRFDEATGDTARESRTGTACAIRGHKSLWRRGVSGACLQFDGYHSRVSLPAAQAPAVKDGLTLAAWIAIGAYPWNWCPLVQQGDDDGYFLGVDGHAHVGFKTKVGSKWQELVSHEQLKRFHWYHVAGVYDKTSGRMTLYLDGKQVAAQSVGSAGIATTSDPIQIGQGMPRRPVDPVRANTFITQYAFDGLMDEVRIYDQALRPEQIAAAYERFKPAPAVVGRPDMDRRALPKFDSGGRFGAHYTRLKFYDVWDNLWRFGPYPDVVVGFDQLPVQFVFWRGTGYIPMLVNEAGQWYSNEFNETWGRSGGRGCQEPMSDKESFFNYARILENTPARVVVQWRFPLVDVHHVIANLNADTGWGDWSDWYYYIYPDGAAVKTMHLWTAGPRNHEWQESMAILGPNQHPEHVLETDPALILADLEGKVSQYSWTQGPPQGVSYRNQKIHIVNYHAQYDPYTIGDFTGGNVYGGEVTPYSVFPSWNHWPVSQVPSDGRYASFPDRTAHSSLTHVRLPTYRADFGDRPFQEKILMEGLSNRPAQELVPLAKSWLHAPSVERLAGGRSRGYDSGQRAYVLAATGKAMTFRINASADQPLVNPCFVVYNWNTSAAAELTINGQRQASGPAFRQGRVRDPNGRQKLVVWLQHQAAAPATFKLSGAQPAAAANRLPPLDWRLAPQTGENTFAIAMTAASLPDAVGAEYFFACTKGPGHDSGWQNTPVYTDTGLAPATQFAYRVKARNLYFVETGWSPEGTARTPAAPPPVFWHADEGRGTRVADSTGRHAGTLAGGAGWLPGRGGQVLHFDGKGSVTIDGAERLASNHAFTWTAWIRTRQGGTILARTGPARKWTQGGKVFFVQDGRLKFDVGWVGHAQSRIRVNDGAWHHVALVAQGGKPSSNIHFYVDGRPAGAGSLAVGKYKESGLPLKIGYCNDNFPGGQSGFVGEIDEAGWFGYALDAQAIRDGYERQRQP